MTLKFILFVLLLGSLNAQAAEANEVNNLAGKSTDAVPTNPDLCTPLKLPETLRRTANGLQYYRMDNGLRVVLAPQPEARSVTVRVAYDTGSRDDPAGLEGLAHFVEHLMFKGSEQVKDGEHFRRVRDVGGEVNAFTEWDLTEYVNRVPTDALRPILESEADRMRKLRLDEDGLRSQQHAIREEESLRITNVPYAAAGAEFLSRLWVNTPYQHSPIGTESSRELISVESAEDFHTRFYGPDNAVIALVGRFDVDRARLLIHELFADLSPRRIVHNETTFTIDRAAIQASIDDPLAPFPVFGLAWHGLGIENTDHHTVALIDELLMGHRDALLLRPLRQDLVFDAYSLSFALRGAGLINYVMLPRTFASFTEVRRKVDAELGYFLRAGPSNEALCLAVRRQQMEQLSQLETPDAFAGALTRGTLVFDDPRHFLKTWQRISRLSPDQVRQIARELFAAEPSTFVIMPTGAMRWLKPALEGLPDGIGTWLEDSLL